jgi:hypothetical protein
MLYQDADSGDTVLVAIALVAMAVFVLMLVTAFAIVRSERKTRSKIPSKDALEPGSPAAGNPRPLPEDERTTELRPQWYFRAPPLVAGIARLFARDAQKNAGVPGLWRTVDGGPNGLKTLNWVICSILATYFAWLNYSHVGHIINSSSLYPYFVLLAVLSPTCIAVAWLRLTGSSWSQSLKLFIWVTVGFGAIWLIVQPLGFIIKYLSGQCC